MHFMRKNRTTYDRGMPRERREPATPVWDGSQGSPCGRRRIRHEPAQTHRPVGSTCGELRNRLPPWHAAGGYPFTLGVASGQPSPNGFVLWTRLAPVPLAPDGLGGISGPASVRWEVAADETMRTVMRSGMTEAHSQWAHSVHIEVMGLEPGRPYWYRFSALGEQSPIGLARTRPAPGAKPASLRFAFASCSNWQLGYFSAYRHMAAENPDLVLFLGDYIYEFTYAGTNANRIVRPHDGPTATDLPGYRNRYALYRTDLDLQALHAAAPCLMTWDDHEVENDYASASSSP